MKYVINKYELIHYLSQVAFDYLNATLVQVLLFSCL